MFFAHPLTGVGPDNYRLEYGPYAGLANFDNRVHSNNMYLEIIAGTGIVGALAFGWLTWVLASLLFTVLKTTHDPVAHPIAVGLALAVGAIALHGTVDSFLSFTPTYVLFAVTLGLVAASPMLIGSDAHRV
jgi:O-antigen ligase